MPSTLIEATVPSYDNRCGQVAAPFTAEEGATTNRIPVGRCSCVLRTASRLAAFDSFTKLVFRDLH